MLMEISMKETGWMIKLTDKEFIFIPTMLDTKANGKTTNNTVKEKNLGQMVLSMKDNTMKEKNMVTAT